MTLNYLYTRLELTLSSLAVLALLEKQHLGLEALAEDLTSIIKSRLLKNLNESAVMMDYLLMLQENADLAIDENDITDEFISLIAMIQQKLQKYALPLPRAIHLEHPNILVLEHLGEPIGGNMTVKPGKLNSKNKE